MTTHARKDGEPARGAAARGLLLFNVGVALLWLLLWALARIQDYAPHASLWFPPAGLTFAVGLTVGWGGLPGVVVGALLATLAGAFYDPAQAVVPLIAPGLAFGLAHGVSYIFGARLILRFGEERPTPRLASALLLFGPLIALAAAVSGLAALGAFGLVASLDEARAALLPFWIGDLVATVALGPCLAAILGAALPRLGLVPTGFADGHLRVGPASAGRSRYWLELALCLLPLATAVTLARLLPEQDHVASFLVFFGIVPLMWIAHTEGAMRTYAATASLSTAIAVAGALLGPGDHRLTFQFAMIILAGSAYFGLAVPTLYADNRSLRQMLTTDPLTGAATRTYLVETAEREIERARRFGTPLALAVLDLDRFKAVNDELGHAFGDHALADVVERLRRQLRASDLLARFGGEEFVLLLPMTELAEATETAERLAQTLRERPVVRGGVHRTVTASFGVAEIDVPTEDFDAAFERADRALYAAKAAGRDRVLVAPGAPAELAESRVQP